MEKISDGNETKRILPFFLPRIRPRYLASSDAEDASLDSAQHYNDFSVKTLAWAIQNSLSVPCIKRYLAGYQTSTVEFELGVAIESKSGDSTYPILFFAAERNSPELVSLLCQQGANPDQRAFPSDLPVLAYTVISAEYEVSDTTSTAIALLAAGADPHVIPKDMWKDYMKRPARTKAAPSGTRLAWCTQELQDALCRTFNLMQRYSLWKADNLARLPPRRKQLGEAHDFMALFAIPYHIIGQGRATQEVLNSVTSHHLFKSKSPLVLLFTGPSGHGKTELAERMGDLLSLESHLVDCTEMQHETDIFGPKAPYLGYEVGSPLNIHLSKWTGQRSVVFLDEFDKTSDDVRKSMLLLFQSGAYRDRRNGHTLNCSKTIWILATNHGEETIKEFWDANLKDQSEEKRKEAPFDELTAGLKKAFIAALGPPLTGRLTAIIPFFPFIESEQAVVAYKFMRDLRNDAREPISIEDKKFAGHIHLNYVDDGQIATRLAKDSYMPQLGARSLESAVEGQVKRKLAEAFQSGSGRITNEMNDGPLMKYDLRVSTIRDNAEEITVKHVGSTALQKP